MGNSLSLGQTWSVAEFLAIEIAEYIERGLHILARSSRADTRVLETPLSFLDLRGRTYHAGILGLALIGKAGDLRTAWDAWQPVSNTSTAGRFTAISTLLGVPVGLARWIELNHRNGIPAAEIAGSLRLGNLGLGCRTNSLPTKKQKSAAAASDADFAPLPLQRLHL